MKLTEFLVFLIVPLGLSCLWIHTAVKCCNGESKWRKWTSLGAAGLCVAGLVAMAWAFVAKDISATHRILLGFGVAGLLLLPARIPVARKISWSFFLLGLLCIFTHLTMSAYACQTELPELMPQECPFQTQQDIEEKLGIKVPACQFNLAFREWGLGNDVLVRFNYDSPDSAALTHLLRDILVEHPLQCELDDGSSEMRMMYSTTFAGQAGRVNYANVCFYNECLYITYGDCLGTDDLRQWAADTMGVDMPAGHFCKCERLRFESGTQALTAYYMLDNPLGQETFSALEKASNTISDFIDLRMYEKADAANEYLRYSVAMDADEDGRFRRVQVKIQEIPDRR